jgi:F420H(2)-dependent quinone reductase
VAFVRLYVEDDRPSVTVAPMDRLKPRTIRLIGRLHAWLWKLTGGRLGKAFGRAPFMMLITKGRITGRERRTPVLYFQHQADLIVVASFGGSDMHPVSGIPHSAR